MNPAAARPSAALTERERADLMATKQRVRLMDATGLTRDEAARLLAWYWQWVRDGAES